MRKFCTTCRPPRTKAKSATKVAPPARFDAVDLVGSVRSDLARAGLVTSPLGQQALMLAQRIVRDEDTGSALASLHKELRLVLGQAMAGAPSEEGDLLDELAARRERRRA
jgi:hypothetical protein